MNSPGLPNLFFTMLAMHLPTLVVSLIAMAILVARWHLIPSKARNLALAGFALALALGLLMPAGQALLQQLVLRDGAVGGRMWMFSAFSISGAFLHAIVYLLLLAAILSGRAPAAGGPPAA